MPRFGGWRALCSRLAAKSCKLSAQYKNGSKISLKMENFKTTKQYG